MTHFSDMQEVAHHIVVTACADLATMGEVALVKVEETPEETRAKYKVTCCIACQKKRDLCPACVRALGITVEDHATVTAPAEKPKPGFRFKAGDKVVFKPRADLFSDYNKFLKEGATYTVKSVFSGAGTHEAPKGAEWLSLEGATYNYLANHFQELVLPPYFEEGQNHAICVDCANHGSGGEGKGYGEGVYKDPRSLYRGPCCFCGEDCDPLVFVDDPPHCDFRDAKCGDDHKKFRKV